MRSHHRTICCSRRAWHSAWHSPSAAWPGRPRKACATGSRPCASRASAEEPRASSMRTASTWGGQGQGLRLECHPHDHPHQAGLGGSARGGTQWVGARWQSGGGTWGVVRACPCAAAKCSGVVPSWHRTLGSARLGPSSVVSMSSHTTGERHAAQTDGWKETKRKRASREKKLMRATRAARKKHLCRCGGQPRA